MRPKRVSFATVEIREYPIVLSTNPASRCGGPSIELGWEYRLASNVRNVDVDEGRLSVLEYESLCPSSRRRSMSKLHLHFYQRLHRVKVHNFSDDEIIEAVREKAKINKSRKRSNTFLNPIYVARETCASAKRVAKIRRAIHNLEKQPKQRPESIYDGWWLPHSSHFF